MRWFPALTLAISLLALGVSTWTWQQADTRAETALQRREKVLVDKYRPKVIKLCREFDVKEPPENAQTLDALLAPLQGLFEGLSK